MNNNRLYIMLFVACLVYIGLSLKHNVQAREGEVFSDGLLWSTKEEIRQKFGPPDFLYSEEEPYRRYKLVRPEEEELQKRLFIYDAPIHDLYYFERNGITCEYRFYYSKAPARKMTYRVTEYSIRFLDEVVPLGKVVEYVPEFKPVYDGAKVFLEHMLNYGNIRLLFVTGKDVGLAKYVGTNYVDPDPDIKDWSLAYDVILFEGEPENISLNSMVKEVIVLVDSESRIKKTAHAFKTRLIKNPFAE